MTQLTSGLWGDVHRRGVQKQREKREERRMHRDHTQLTVTQPTETSLLGASVAGRRRTKAQDGLLKSD